MGRCSGFEWEEGMMLDGWMDGEIGVVVVVGFCGGELRFLGVEGESTTMFCGRIVGCSISRGPRVEASTVSICMASA